jgi:hypothetical protein
VSKKISPMCILFVAEVIYIKGGQLRNLRKTSF